MIGYTTSRPARSAGEFFDDRDATKQVAMASCAVSGVGLYRFPSFCDARGELSVGEFKRDFPFEPQRYFVVYNVPDGESRGGHTHDTCAELLVCVRGSLSVVVDDGREREEIRLDGPRYGLHLPPMVWATQYKHSQDAVLLVFASHAYDTRGYIRNYEDFVRRRAASA